MGQSLVFTESSCIISQQVMIALLIVYSVTKQPTRVYNLLPVYNTAHMPSAPAWPWAMRFKVCCTEIISQTVLKRLCARRFLF